MAKPSTANRLLVLWQRCRRLPGGQWLFSRIIAHRVPYSGTINARIEDLKKARGTIVAEAHCAVPDTREQHEDTVEARLQDDAGDEVARFKARWVVGPKN